MRLLFTFARAYPGRTALTFLAVLLAGTTEGLSLGTVLPLLADADESGMGGKLGAALEDVLATVGLSPTIGVLVGVIILGFVLKALLLLLASRLIAKTVAYVATDLRLSLIRSLLATRWEYYLHRPVGSIANAAGSEAMRSSLAYQRGTAVVSLCFQACVYTAVACLLSWQATLAGVLAGGLVVLVLSRLVQTARMAGKRQTQHMKALVTRLTDNLQSVKPLKSMGRTDLADVVLVQDTHLLNDAIERQVFSKEALRSLQEPLTTTLLVLGLFVALQVVSMDLATVAVLVILMSKIMGRMGKVQRHLQQAAASESAYFSLREEIDNAEAAREPDTGTKPAHLAREIRIADVGFSYDGHQVFDGVSLAIPAGKITSFVGPSGEGKTTLIDLVTGLLRPERGDVFLDDTPLAEVALKTWRRKIGYVPQDTILLHDSILLNVTLGDPELTEADAERALRGADAWDFVAALPEGLHTSVGERGARLSGGQRQRIAIARALVHRPELVILDEATSALDPGTARSICDTLSGLKGDLTMLAISHQSDLVDASDIVYRLENGKVTRLEHGVVHPPRVKEPTG